MGFIKHLMEKIGAQPADADRKAGNIYFDIYKQSISADVADSSGNVTNVDFTPQADWNQVDHNKSSYIANKPELGTVSSYDVIGADEEIAQNQRIPTNRKVYDALHKMQTEVDATKSLLHGPLPARGIAEMTDTNSIYLYLGYIPEPEEGEEPVTEPVVEEGMALNHVYYYKDNAWKDLGAYNDTVIETDKGLTRNNRAADALVVGNKFNELTGDLSELNERVSVNENALALLDDEKLSYCNGLDVVDGYVYILHNGVRIDNVPYGPFAGQGGGSGGGSGVQIDAVFSATNETDWNMKTISGDTDVLFDFTWESIENDAPSGKGNVTVTVNNVQKARFSVNQGHVQVNLKSYLSSGSNRIRIRIEDQYEQAKIWSVTVELVDLSIESSFDTSFPFDDAINFPYTPYGAVSKTVYFIVDGVELGTVNTSITGRQLSYVIPAQSHGSHTLDVFFESEIGGEIVTSNTLHYEFICVDETGVDPIIASSFTETTQKQYATVNIPFVVYTPSSLTSVVQIYANDVLVSTQTVDRTSHTYGYKANQAGSVAIKFVSGETQKVINLTITSTDIDVEAETEALVLYLNAEGRSNGEDPEERATWKYGNIESTLTGFAWNNLDGWQSDAEGVTVLRLVRDARVTVPYKLFANDFKTTGKTIELEFETNNVVDYSTPLISCKQGGIGLEVTPQTVTFNGAQTELMTPFKENERVRLSIVVEKQTEYRLIYFYINGVMSSAIQYASGERFDQLNPVNITIGSSTCGIDIYCIRVYDNALTRMQIVNNWIADTQDGELMIERFNKNNIYDAYGNISPSTLVGDIPYFIISCEELPQYKGDKKVCYGSYTDPQDPTKSFTFEGCQINVQGTSSQGYFRKNYDMQFKKGFEFASGHKDAITIINAVPFNRFVLKADVASSESANNTLLSMFFSDSSPYKTPEMLADEHVRLGIEGKPALLFWNNLNSGNLEFLGK